MNGKQDDNVHLWVIFQEMLKRKNIYAIGSALIAETPEKCISDEIATHESDNKCKTINETLLCTIIRNIWSLGSLWSLKVKLPWPLGVCSETLSYNVPTKHVHHFNSKHVHLKKETIGLFWKMRTEMKHEVTWKTLQ